MTTREELKSVRFVINVSKKNLKTDGRLYKAQSITPVEGSTLKIECYMKYTTPQRHVIFFAKTMEEATAILNTEKKRLMLHKINPKLSLSKVDEIVDGPKEAPAIVEEKAVAVEVVEEVVEELEEEETSEEVELDKMTKTQLIELCEEKGLNSSGTKKEILKRLSE